MTKPIRAKAIAKSAGSDHPNSTPEPASATSKAPKGKIPVLIALLENPRGATIAEMMAATGWQAHSVRGAIAGAIKKGRGLAVLSEKTAGGRVYRMGGEA